MARFDRPDHEGLVKMAADVIHEALDDVLEQAAQQGASDETMAALEETAKEMEADEKLRDGMADDIIDTWDVYEDELKDMTPREAESDLEDGASSVVYFAGDKEGNIEWVYSFGDPSFFQGTSDPYVGVAYLPLPDIADENEDETEGKD